MRLIRRGGRTGRRWAWIGEWFDTLKAVAQGAREFLERVFGRLVAAAMLSRKDTSRRSRGACAAVG